MVSPSSTSLIILQFFFFFYSFKLLLNYIGMANCMVIFMRTLWNEVHWTTYRNVDFCIIYQNYKFAHFIKRTKKGCSFHEKDNFYHEMAICWISRIKNINKLSRFWEMCTIDGCLLYEMDNFFAHFMKSAISMKQSHNSLKYWCTFFHQNHHIVSINI